MVWHVPENETAGTPYSIVVTTPGAASGARSTVVTGWPAAWTAFPKIVSALRAGVLLGNLEVTAQAAGTLTISGVIDGFTDFALAANDTLELRPSKLAITEVQAAIDANDAAVVHIAGTETVTGTKTFSGTLTAGTMRSQGAGAGYQVTRRDNGLDSWQFYDPNDGFYLYNAALASNAFLLAAADSKVYFAATVSTPDLVAYNTLSVPLVAASAADHVLKITDGTSGPATFSTVARSPTSLAANTNNYAPGVARFLRLTASATVNITGLVAGVDGQEIHLWNIGTNAITLTNQDAASTAANRWRTTTGANIVLAAGKAAFAVYDLTSTAWRVSLLP